METEEKPGQAMDPNATLQNYKNCHLFYVVREHSRRHSSSSGQAQGPGGQGQLSATDPGVGGSSFQMDSIDAAAYKEFHGLQMLMTKLKIRTDVTISIHNERIDVYPKKGQSMLHNTSGGGGGNSDGGSSSSVGGGAGGGGGSSARLVSSVVNSLGYKQETFNLDAVVDATATHKPIPATDKIRHRVGLIVVGCSGSDSGGGGLNGKYRIQRRIRTWWSRPISDSFHSYNG